MIISNELRKSMLPRPNEAIGNLGGNAYVLAVISKTEVIATIPALAWHFKSIVDRGFDGQLMAVKFS